VSNGVRHSAPHRGSSAPLPPLLKQWRHEQPSADNRTALAHAVLLALADLHSLAPGIREQLLGSADLAGHFWEPAGLHAEFFAALVPAIVHGAPALSPSEPALRSLLDALCDERTAAELQAVRPDQLSALFESILATGRARQRATGVFYTPSHVVEYILENTVLPTHGDNSAPIPRVLDPACGTGAFLLPAFRARAGSQAQGVLTPLTSLYGVDIDPYAVAATRLALLLAIREAQPNRATPPAELLELIASRVVCGDALVSPNDQSDRAGLTTEQGAMPKVLVQGGFDAIIGNPPYLNVKRGALKGEKERFAAHYLTARGQYDAFGLFVERTLELLAADGLLAFVVPRPLLAGKNYAPVRQLLLQQKLEVIADAGTPFAGVAVEAAIVVVRRARASRPLVRLERLRPGEPARVLGHADQSLFHELPSQALSYRLTDTTAPLVRRLVRTETRLADYTALLTRGLELGKRSPAILPASAQAIAAGARPLLRGEDIGRYAVRPAGLVFRHAQLPPAEHMVAEYRERLLMRRVSARIEAALDRSSSLTLNTVYSLVPRAGIDAALLLGILNSRLIGFYLRVVYLSDDRLFPYIRLSQLAALPMPPLQPATALEAEWRHELITLSRAHQEELTGAHGHSTQPDTNAARERQIDWLVCQIFRLNDAEIALIHAETA